MINDNRILIAELCRLAGFELKDGRPMVGDLPAGVGDPPHPADRVAHGALVLAMTILTTAKGGGYDLSDTTMAFRNLVTFFEIFLNWHRFGPFATAGDGGEGEGDALRVLTYRAHYNRWDGKIISVDVFDELVDPAATDNTKSEF